MHEQHYFFHGTCYCGEKEQKEITIGSIVKIIDFSYVPDRWNPYCRNCYQLAKDNMYIVVTEEGNLWGLRPVHVPIFWDRPNGEFFPGVNFPSKETGLYFIGKNDHSGIYCPKKVVQLIH